MNDGSVYSGEFVDGLKCGIGRWRKAKIPNTNMYEGQYSNNMKHGFGIFKWNTGNIYIGHYVNDKREGLGKMLWSDGSYYIGEWKDGIQNGFGRMYFPDGLVKEGIFVNNVLKGINNSDWGNVPPELLNTNFDIMRCAPTDIEFSDEITRGLHGNSKIK